MIVVPTGAVGETVLRFGRDESNDAERRVLRDAKLIRLDGGAWQFTGYGLAVWGELVTGRTVLIPDCILGRHA